MKALTTHLKLSLIYKGLSKIMNYLKELGHALNYSIPSNDNSWSERNFAFYKIKPSLSKQRGQTTTKEKTGTGNDYSLILIADMIKQQLLKAGWILVAFPLCQS